MQALTVQKKDIENDAIGNYRAKKMSGEVVDGNFRNIFVDANAFKVAKAFEID